MQNIPITFQHSTNRHKILQKDFIFKHCNNFPNETIFIILKENKKKKSHETIFRVNNKNSQRSYLSMETKNYNIKSSQETVFIGNKQKLEVVKNVLVRRGRRGLPMIWGRRAWICHGFFSLSFSELFAFVYYKVFGRV